ncbi:MAG: phage tail sheath subtilisin-like domain-containing protein [Acidobacteriia bacterium]|nr:phage tail sheath subtilisin-like domain-containing protein [Terriglobia bacterium]
MVYVTHAVSGFFENGGSACYFVRVGTGVQAWLDLNDRAATPKPTLRVQAVNEGTAGNAIKITVSDSSIANTKVSRVSVSLASASALVAVVGSAADAAKFVPGDIVFLQEGANSDRATIARIDDVNITLQDPLANTYTNAGTIRVADLNPGQTTVRVDDATGIEPGSYISLTLGGTKENAIVQSVQRAAKLLVLSKALVNGFPNSAADITVATLEFDLKIDTPGVSVEQFLKLAMDKRHSHYFAKIVDSQAVTVQLTDPPSPTNPPNNMPVAGGPTTLANGVDEDLTALHANQYRKGIDALEKIDDVNILCVPDASADNTIQASIQQYMIDHCQKMKDRFAIIDSIPKAQPSNGVVTQRNNLSTDNGYAALYYPWIYIDDPSGDGQLLVPPSGHVAGVYAQTDNDRGVHKAPANVKITGARGVELTLNDFDQGPLNEQGVNVLRVFKGRGVIIWGARTVAPASITAWRYVNVRRLVTFVEESIQKGTQFAVFEPNDLPLWQKLKRQVSDFLTGVWRSGALVGATPDKAFSVRVDAELNPPSQVALGLLVIEVKIYPVTPAEFVVFRIIQQPGGPSVQEG